MAASHLIVCFFATIFFSAGLSSTVTIIPDETDDSSLEDVVKTFREEVTELRDIVSVLQDHIISNDDDDSHTTRNQQVREIFLNNVLRRSRRSDTALTLTNDSVANSTEDLGYTYNYHPYPPSVGGTVYTHWGRDDCADGSELVYSGMVTGAYSSQTGGGVNYLCLPHEPIYSEVETTTHATRSLLYNAEFETSTAPVFQDLHDQTPTCAICRAPPTRVTKLMIPGRNECPSSKWRLEYKGYLMSSVYTATTRTDFMCMDEDSVAVPGTTGSQSGALLYMVEGRCSAGGIQCGPYVNGYELTCAVCTI